MGHANIHTHKSQFPEQCSSYVVWAWLCTVLCILGMLCPNRSSLKCPAGRLSSTRRKTGWRLHLCHSNKHHFVNSIKCYDVISKCTVVKCYEITITCCDAIIRCKLNDLCQVPLFVFVPLQSTVPGWNTAEAKAWQVGTVHIKC